MANEGFHEIQLSGKHLVALFMAATVVAVVVFLCGVMVGRDVQKQRFAVAAAASEMPPDPTAPERSTAPVEPDAAVGDVAPAAPASSPEILSYPDRLAGTAPPAESMKPAAAPARSSAPPPRREAPAAGALQTRAEPAGSGFAVQVAAVGERSEADGIAKRLASKGYPAYVMSPVAGSPRVFRVRVGKFKDRREAEQVAGRLQREEQFKPWITR